MRVLWVISSLELGGAELVLINLANSLVRKGHDIGIYVLSNNISLYDKLDEKVKVYYLDSHKSLSRKIISVYFHLFKIAKSYDVIVGALEFLPSYLVAITAMNKKKIMWIHTELDAYCNSFSLLSKLIAKLFYSINFQYICVSNSAVQSLKKLAFSKSIKADVIYNMMVVPEDSSLKVIKDKDKDKDKVSLLIVARLEKVKQVHLAIKAMQYVPDNYELNIAGKGSEYVDLVKLASELNLDNKVNFLGYISNPKYLYKSSDLFIFTSMYEGFGGVLIEAMTFGLPILSTCNHGAPMEILDHGRLCFQSSEDPKDIAKNIMRAISNKEQLVELSKIGMNISKIYSPENVLLKWEKYFAKRI